MHSVPYQAFRPHKAVKASSPYGSGTEYGESWNELSHISLSACYGQSEPNITAYFLK